MMTIDTNSQDHDMVEDEQISHPACPFCGEIGHCQHLLANFEDGDSEFGGGLIYGEQRQLLAKLRFDEAGESDEGDNSLFWNLVEIVERLDGVVGQSFCVDTSYGTFNQTSFWSEDPQKSLREITREIDGLAVQAAEGSTDATAAITPLDEAQQRAWQVELTRFANEKRAAEVGVESRDLLRKWAKLTLPLNGGFFRTSQDFGFGCSGDHDEPFLSLVIGHGSHRVEVLKDLATNASDVVDELQSKLKHVAKNAKASQTRLSTAGMPVQAKAMFKSMYQYGESYASIDLSDLYVNESDG